MGQRHMCRLQISMRVCPHHTQLKCTSSQTHQDGYMLPVPHGSRGVVSQTLCREGETLPGNMLRPTCREALQRWRRCMRDGSQLVSARRAMSTERAGVWTGSVWTAPSGLACPAIEQCSSHDAGGAAAARGPDQWPVSLAGEHICVHRHCWSHIASHLPGHCSGYPSGTSSRCSRVPAHQQCSTLSKISISVDVGLARLHLS